MNKFDEMGLPEALNHTLLNMQFQDPTPIQEQAIPVALSGRDILGSAQTGTGKTGAFGIPLVARLMSDPNSAALVMTPTRELAAQVMTQLQAMLGKRSKIKTALLIGGEPMPKQLSQLRQNPRLVVGTPGRINDHLKRQSLKLSQTNFLVLDETDRMLDMGFTIQIENVMSFMPLARQTLLFSATMPKNIVAIAKKYLNNPVQIAVNTNSSPAKNIQQEMIKLSEGEKYPRLISELNARKGSVIIFVKTKYGTEKMAKRLSAEGLSADAIHGDLRQNKRDKVIKAYRDEKYRILVATDVAARGLDIPHIAHVINYDLPQAAEDYIHRIGRTARAGAKGQALNLVTPADRAKWHAIERLMNPDAPSEMDAPPAKKGKKSSKPRKFSQNPSKSGKSANAKKSEGKPFKEKSAQKKGRDKPRDEQKPAQKKRRFNTKAQSHSPAFQEQGFKKKRANSRRNAA